MNVPPPEEDADLRDVVALLALQLEDLAGLPEKIGEIDSLVRMVAFGTEHELNEVKATVSKLAEQVAAAGLDIDAPAWAEDTKDTDKDKNKNKDKAAPKAHSWVEKATAQDWQDLANWVDWLVATYQLQPSRTVLPCWPAHPGVAEELAALHSAWRQAATKGAGKLPNDALIYWHDRWFHPCVLRLREASQFRQCLERHVEARPAKPADEALLTAAKNHARQAPPSEPRVDRSQS